MNTALILAGGTGTRIGADIPKQFIEIQGRPILAYTLDVFQNNQNIDAIGIVCHSEWIKETSKLVKKYAITKTHWIIQGGDTFQESVRNGVFHLKRILDTEDMVVISFGVSPMTTDAIIDDSIRVATAKGNAIASEDMVLCTCIKDNEYSTTKNIPRDMLKGFSNPWTFRFGDLYEIYETAMEKGVLNDIDPHTTSLYLAFGKRLYFSMSTTSNIKITTKEDLDIFEGWLLLKQNRKTKSQEGGE